MVNVGHLISIAFLLNAVSYGLSISKDPNCRNQLSPENGNRLGGSQYTFIRPNLSKREADFEKNGRINNDFVNGINDENYDENNVSYFSRIADIKNIHSIKKVDTPVKGTDSDWNNEYYVTNGRISTKLVDSQKLRIYHYLGMGKEKWAGFLATSSSAHFQHIMKKLKKVVGKSEDHLKKSEGDCYDSETDIKPDNNTEKSKVEGEKKYVKNVENADQFSYELKYSKIGNRDDSIKQLPFSDITKDDIVKLRSMFSDVSKYCELQDAKDVIKAADHVTYEDFKVEGEDEVFGSELPSEEEYQIHEEETLEALEPDDIKTDEQKMWLKSTALRRANLIQKLFDGKLDNEDIYESDHVHLKHSNVFVNEDDSEFENMSPGFKIQSTNLALYIAFMATEIAFVIGF